MPDNLMGDVMEIEKCGWCGGEVEICGGSRHRYVACNGSCEMCGPDAASESEAVEAWNTIAVAVRRSREPAPVAAEKPDAGWIPWTGGSLPVSPSTYVDIRLRDGTDDLKLEAEDVAWEWLSRCDDVVAYRLSVPETETGPESGAEPTPPDADLAEVLQQCAALLTAPVVDAGLTRDVVRCVAGVLGRLEFGGVS